MEEARWAGLGGWVVIMEGVYVFGSLQSHNDWDIGEQIDRDYDWSKYSKTGIYGMDTPHDNSGILVSNTLDWSKSTYV